MAYKLQTDEETAYGVRRVAGEQVELAIAVFSDKRLLRSEAVHQARQQCKKIRALLQLLGDSNSDLTKFENASIRDAAAKLAHLRDADALLETYDDFRKHIEETVSCRVLNAVCQVLTHRRQSIDSQDSQVKNRIEGFIADMTAAKVRLNCWVIQPSCSSELLLGFARSHRHARRAMKACRRSPTDETFHDWRKWSKYQFYQSQLLGPFLKKTLKHRIVDLKRLGNLLGTDHDLAVLRQELFEAPDFNSVREMSRIGGVLQALDRRRKQLQSRSLKLGKLLYMKGIKGRLRLPA